MPSQVITRADPQAAPYVLELGANDSLEPTAVFAHFDGSGAASAFLPCVTYYTQDGKVFARAFPDVSVDAGGSADVSWFPGLANAATKGNGSRVTVSPIAGGPPSSPQNGDLWVATDVDLASVIAWQFVYVAGLTYPWTFIGGAPWFEYWSGAATAPVASGAWELVRTTQPRLTIPRDGLYSYEWGGVFELSAATNAFATVATSVGDAANTPYSWTTVVGSTTFAGRGDDATRSTPRTAGDLLGMYLQSTITADVHYLFPWVALTPIAIR